ncbi:hypothetical protein [Luteolibacter sp. AS25]|uniref:hypothetical protein n=1 Tax=Luteolibacter sp. AS25 TaxID=3135776 RepID=UPI00398AFDAE
MDTLQLSPLPSESSDAAKGYRRLQDEGFVDESAVLAVIAKSCFERVYAKPEEMVLSSNPDDYAGWALPVESPFRQMAEITTSPVTEEILEQRVAAAPKLPEVSGTFEPGISTPHSGNHRWWLFGVSGAMCCGIFSLMLLSLAQRATISEMLAGYEAIVPRFQPTEVVMEEARIEPTLVDASVRK